MSLNVRCSGIRPMVRWKPLAAVSALVLAVTSCGGGTPARPTPTPPITLPTVTCPAPPQATQSPDGGPVQVHYPPATATGGYGAVTVACTPESGSMFPTGSTTVACTATDAAQRTDSCTFAVTVLATPRISATRFVAFGDSITVGEQSIGRRLLVLRPEASYPTTLRDLLTSRYTAQSFVITNAGLGGERVTQAGEARLRGVLLEHRPEVLLLMEGVNDLNGDGEAAIPNIVAALRSMVRDAQSLGVRVFVGTLLPQRPGGSRALSVGLIPEVNDLLRAMAADEGADLVDLYQGFGGQPGALIGDDGLHPTTAGYEKIAEIFFEALRATLEVPQPAASPSRSWPHSRSFGAH